MTQQEKTRELVEKVMPLPPVITTVRGAEVCQECLVKWARFRRATGKDNEIRYLCRTCDKKAGKGC